jgi:hypothetical protein
MPRGFPPAAFRSALSYRARPGDFFIATYPKCGTTWAQHIVYLLAHGGEPLPPSASMSDAIPHLEEAGAAAVSTLPAPRYIKTHLPFEMTPYDPAARYLYVARNPFDCAVSFYHHTRGFVRHYDFADGSFADYFECFIAGTVDFGDYFDHVVSWYAHRDDANVLLLTYEAMSADPSAAVIAIADFMQTERIDDGAVLAAVLEHSSFESMSRDQQRWSSTRPAGMPAFIRRGIVGDWVNYFSAAQAARLIDKFEQRLGATDFERLWAGTLERARGIAATVR